MSGEKERSVSGRSRVIAVDFDGTLFETKYPTILSPRLPVIEQAKKRWAEGDKLILWTCREGRELETAVTACRSFGLERRFAEGELLKFPLCGKLRLTR